MFALVLRRVLDAIAQRLSNASTEGAAVVDESGAATLEVKGDMTAGLAVSRGRSERKVFPVDGVSHNLNRLEHPKLKAKQSPEVHYETP